MQGNSGYWLQPPPSLPRRGGTDTLGCLIAGKEWHLSLLITNSLPINKSNLHLPYGGEREGADVQKLSNQSLTLGKVRMGCPLGKVRMSYPFGKLGGFYFTLTFTLCMPFAVRALTTYIPAGRFGETSDIPLYERRSLPLRSNNSTLAPPRTSLPVRAL